MNIYIPHQWLLEHIDTDASPQEIARCLSLCGPSVERLEDREGEIVYDIEVTTNRVDMMSIRGIAREVAAILPEFDYQAKLKPLLLPDIINPDPLGIDIINDPKLCPHISAIKLSNITIKPSPPLIQKRLRQVGQRPINNAIDITNYVMWEIGHPIHAFDYDRITTQKIVVRKAKKGEKFTTLDNQKYSTTGGEVIFDDGTGRIIDLPGIMGTANTVVTSDTTSVLLWIEDVPAEMIRSASMKHNIRTQAAVLNEKHVDADLAFPTLKQAIKLYCLHANAVVSSQIFEEHSRPKKQKPIRVTQDQITKYLGITLEPQQIQQMLQRLQFKVDLIDDTFVCIPPTFRKRDITIYQDVIEEIARLYGYHNLASIVMPTTIPDNPPAENFALEMYIKQWLAGWGAQEAYTYSLVSTKLAKQSGYPLKQHIQVKNPLTDDGIFLRRSLLPSLVSMHHQNPNWKGILFEFQKTYHPQPQVTLLPHEPITLALTTNRSFPTLKGILEAIQDILHLDFTIHQNSHADPMFDPDTSGEIHLKQQKIGSIGQLRTGDQIFGFEINFDLIKNNARTYPHQLKIYKHPPIIEDLTFTITQPTPIGPILATIKQTDQIIERVDLKDSYKDNYTFTITYQAESALSSKDIAPIRKMIVKKVTQKHQAPLVGKLQT